MPWTFSHPAAVLPLLRLTGPGKLSFAALVVGSMSPDFVYYVGRFDLGGYTHTLPGVLLVCLPAGLLVLSIARWLREPIARLLPQPHREALLATAGVAAPPRPRAVGLLAASLVLGAATHLLWDAFTHDGHFFVRHMEILRVSLLTVAGREVRVFNIAQHASTVAGITFLALAYARFARRFGTFNRPTVENRRRYVVLGFMALAAIVCAVPLALMDATGLDARTNISKLVVRQVVYATTFFFALLSCTALWQWRSRDVGGG